MEGIKYIRLGPQNQNSLCQALGPFIAVSSVWYLLEKAAQCKRGLLSAHFKQMPQVIRRRWKLRREGMREWKKEGKR